MLCVLSWVITSAAPAGVVYGYSGQSQEDREETVSPATPSNGRENETDPEEEMKE